MKTYKGLEYEHTTLWVEIVQFLYFNSALKYFLLCSYFPPILVCAPASIQTHARSKLFHASTTWLAWRVSGAQHSKAKPRSSITESSWKQLNHHLLSSPWGLGARVVPLPSWTKSELYIWLSALERWGPTVHNWAPSHNELLVRPITRATLVKQSKHQSERRCLV